MRVRLVEACGIEHQADADLIGMTASGDLHYKVIFPIDADALMDATLHVDELPASALLEVQAGGEPGE